MEAYKNVFMTYLVKAFRRYNQDLLSVTIDGIGKFAIKDNNVADLLGQLKNEGFDIILIGENESLDSLKISVHSNKDKLDFVLHFGILSLIELSSRSDISIVEILIMKSIAQIICRLKILYKAIVLDLDDTLWKGILSEDGIEKIIENLRSQDGVSFVSFMRFVKILAEELGIFVAICSRNDPEMVSVALKRLDKDIFPLKNYIDCIIANYNDKSKNLNHIANYLSILPDAMIFVDDNKVIRDEVRKLMPKMFVPEWTTHVELTTELLVGCFFERKNISFDSQNRRKRFHRLKVEREKNAIPTLYVSVSEDTKHEKAYELYAKSNQFNFSQKNRNFDDTAKSICFELFRQNGENLGLCSALTYTLTERSFIILNWAISCRFFEIGVEEMVLLYIQKLAGLRCVKIDFNYQQNNRVKILLDRYHNLFVVLDKNVIEVHYTENVLNELAQNTNLKFQTIWKKE